MVWTKPASLRPVRSFMMDRRIHLQELGLCDPVTIDDIQKSLHNTRIKIPSRQKRPDKKKMQMLNKAFAFLTKSKRYMPPDDLDVICISDDDESHPIISQATTSVLLQHRRCRKDASGDGQGKLCCSTSACTTSPCATNSWASVTGYYQLCRDNRKEVFVCMVQLKRQ